MACLLLYYCSIFAPKTLECIFFLELCEVISIAVFLSLLYEKLRQNNGGNCSHEHGELRKNEKLNQVFHPKV